MEGAAGVEVRERMSELGRLLAAAEGYQVLTSTGARLGRVEHVRYEQHADRPDEIVVRSRRLLWTRRRAYPLSAVHEINPRERTVLVGPVSGAAASPGQPDVGTTLAAPEPGPRTPDDTTSSGSAGL
jgi:hypothetical protein